MVAVIIVISVLAATSFLFSRSQNNESTTYSSMEDSHSSATVVDMSTVSSSSSSSLASQNYSFSSFSSLSSSVYIPNPWIQTESFPAEISRESCVSSSGYIYCIQVGEGYYAKLSPNGGIIGSWMLTQGFPDATLSEDGPSCATDEGIVVCIGYNTDPVPTYYANLTSSGIGNWMKGPNFPSKSPNELTACAASSGYVYCSTQNVNGGNGISEFYYLKTPSSFAADNESGASANQQKWTQTTTYPPTVAGSESCAGYQGYIYCSGGVRASGYGTGESYYASITSDGTLSGWLQMKSNPANTYFDNLGGCVATDGYLQCGAYFAPIPQSGGIGDWIKMSKSSP
jgi:hypothetical protein